MNPIWKPLAERDAPQQTEDRIPYTPDKADPAVLDFREQQRKKRDAAQQARMDALTADLELRARLYANGPDDAA